jgi:hypothetical protein
MQERNLTNREFVGWKSYSSSSCLRIRAGENIEAKLFLSCLILGRGNRTGVYRTFVYIVVGQNIIITAPSDSAGESKPGQ